MFRPLLLSCAVAVFASSLAFAQTKPPSRPTQPGSGSRPAPTPTRPTIGPNSPTPNFPGVPGISGPVQLMIRIVYPNDRPVGQFVRVQLLNSTGIAVQDGFTNSEGQVQFPAGPGSYRVKITGEGLEDTTSDTFYVQSEERMHSEWIHAKVRQSETAVGSTQPMISASELNVPSKARKEFDKGGKEFLAGKLDKALKHYQKAVSEYPEYALAYNNIGAIYIRQQDVARAEQAFSKAVSIDPNLPSANSNLGRLRMHAHNYAEAIPFFDRALAGEPNNPQFLLLMAESQLMSHHYDEAIKYAHKAHGLEHQKYAVVHVVAARAYEAKNNPQQARAEYEVYLKEAPDTELAAQIRKALGDQAVAATKAKP